MDGTGEGDSSLLNHKNSSHRRTNSKKNKNSHSYVDENNIGHGGVFLNSIMHPRDASPMRGRRRDIMELHDSGDNSSMLQELLHHVKQLTEELHQRHINSDADTHFKSEWRMVALVLDRLLLIIFFIITVLTSTVIFLNQPNSG